MTSQQQLVCDSSTLANFKAWAKPISDWMRSVGYTNTADTGQVNWTTISSVPGANAYVYDIFQSNDSFTRFYIKLEYGNVTGSSNSPTIRITLGTGTSGTGDLTLFTTQVFLVNGTSFTPASTTTQYECNFSGDTANSRVGVMMWRNAPANQTQALFAIERSLDSTGAATSTYVTIWTCGYGFAPTAIAGKQQSLHFTLGAAPILPDRNMGTVATGWNCRNPLLLMAGSGAFNNSIPVDMPAPFVGLHDYPCTIVGTLWGADITEGVTFQTTWYGAVRTYMPSKNGSFACATAPVAGNTAGAICMRYD